MRLLSKSRGGPLSESWRQSPRTVRPRSFGRVPLWLCLLAFCATAMVVYRRGRERWRPLRTGPTYTATAYVVARSQRSNEGETRVPIVFTADNPRQAAETANALADRYAAARHAQWQAEIEGPCLKARQAAAVARQDYSECMARLAQFERQLREMARAAAARPKPTVEPARPAPPSMIENPKWLELQRRLAELQRRREKLLVDRTPLHPAVQEIDVRIADAQQQLAAVARQIPNPRANDRSEKAATVARAEKQAAEHIAKENHQKLRNSARRSRRRVRRVTKPSLPRNGPSSGSRSGRNWWSSMPRWCKTRWSWITAGGG